MFIEASNPFLLLFVKLVCGGAKGERGSNGWKPKNKKVRTNDGRSGRSFRMHKTMAFAFNFSSANSSRDMNECFDAS